MAQALGTLAERQLELLRRMAALDPAPCFIGGYAEDSLLAGTVTRPHVDLDWLCPRHELAVQLEQAGELGFAEFETWGESAPGEPFYLFAQSGELKLEVGVADDTDAGIFLRIHRLAFEIGGDEAPAGYRLRLPDDTFRHPPAGLDGVRIRTASPLALYQLRVGIASQEPIGPRIAAHRRVSRGRKRLMAAGCAAVRGRFQCTSLLPRAPIPDRRVGVAWARSKQEGSMQRLTLITVACAAIIGVVASVGSSGAQQPGPPTGTLELVQLNRETRFKFVDNPPRSGDPGRPSPGDLAIITARLRDTANRRAGKLYALFMRLAGKRRHVDQVRATFVLGDGHIVVEGISRGGRTDNAAVTGGTGRYAGARGTLRVTQERRVARYRFTFIG